MDLTDVRLIATDMDGTLLNSQKQLPEGFFSLFERLQEKEILFAAASGRQFYNLKNQFSSISDQMAFIAENGSYVVYKDQPLLVQAMDDTTVHELILISRTIPNAYIILCGQQQAYIENTSPEFMKHVEMYYDRRQIVDDLLAVTDDTFLKIAICDLAGSEGNSYRHFKRYEDALQVKVSGSIWLDLSHQLANKGRAIKALQEHFNISYDQTMVFGDYLNDLEMMREAYFSYAMQNAHPEITDTCRFTTASNDEDGVTSVIANMLQKMDAKTVSL